MKKNILFALVLAGMLSACHSTNEEKTDGEPARAQNDSSVMVEFDNKTDSELLLEGYYKIDPRHTVSVLFRSGRLLDNVDFSVYDSSLSATYKTKFASTIDSMSSFIAVLGDKKPHITIKHIQPDGQYGITKEIYSLFPKPWFSSFTHDSARIKSELTLVTLQLGTRGNYFKINYRNDLLPTSFDANAYILSTLGNNQAKELTVWCPPLGEALQLQKEEIIPILQKMIQGTKTQYIPKFELFADTATLVCLSFNATKPKPEEKLPTKPSLELFLSLYDNNSIAIASNGSGYGAFQFNNIAPLKAYLKKYFE